MGGAFPLLILGVAAAAIFCAAVALSNVGLDVPDDAPFAERLGWGREQRDEMMARYFAALFSPKHRVNRRVIAWSIVVFLLAVASVPAVYYSNLWLP